LSFPPSPSCFALGGGGFGFWVVVVRAVAPCSPLEALYLRVLKVFFLTVFPRPSFPPLRFQLRTLFPARKLKCPFGALTLSAYFSARNQTPLDPAEFTFLPPPVLTFHMAVVPKPWRSPGWGGGGFRNSGSFPPSQCHLAFGRFWYFCGFIVLFLGDYIFPFVPFGVFFPMKPR